MNVRSGLLFLAGLLFTGGIAYATGYNFVAVIFGILGSFVLGAVGAVPAPSGGVESARRGESVSRKWVWFTAALVLITFTAVPVVAFFAPPPAAGASGGSSGGSPPASSTNCSNPCAVTIVNSQFGTGSQVKGGNGYLVVKAGTQVTWVNRDNTQHTTTSNSGLWDSGILNPGQSFSFTFNTPGTYSYICNVHPMTGVVIVVP